MLRRTGTQRIFFTNLGLGVDARRFAEAEDFENYIRYTKETRKLARYYASGWTRSIDMYATWFMYEGRRPTLVVQRYYDGCVWNHRDQKESRWEIKFETPDRATTANVDLQGFVRERNYIDINPWPVTMQGLWKHAWSSWSKGLSYDEAITMVEQKGERYRIDDPYTKIENATENDLWGFGGRHNLYVHNFVWKNSPEEAMDPDYSPWKGDSEIDYTGCDKDAKNEFQSMWSKLA